MLHSTKSNTFMYKKILPCAILLAYSVALCAKQFVVSFLCDTCRAPFTAEILAYTSKTQKDLMDTLGADMDKVLQVDHFIVPNSALWLNSTAYFFQCYDRWRIAQNGFDWKKDLRVGDLIFQDLDCGALCEAIEKVTEGAGGKDFSHLGLVVASGDTLAVVEAIGSAVQLTGIQKFIQRSKTPDGKPKIVVTRPKSRWQRIAKGAAVAAKGMIGVPYDDAFLPDNGRLYCSEMVALAFQGANQGEPFFLQKPMTFKDPDTGQFFPAWVEYYQKLGIPIPEGLSGCNPGGLSMDRKLELIFSNY